VSELYHGYVETSRSKGQQPYPEAVFQKLIPGLVYQWFGLRKAHDLVRVDAEGTRHCSRGFHGLSWKSACSD
jgi:hypothetical protein